MVNMVNGPKQRKFTCSSCNVYRWCEDFSGRSASELDDSSVCDFCRLEARFEERFARLLEADCSLKEENKLLREEVNLLKGEVDRLQGLKDVEKQERSLAPDRTTGSKLKKKKGKKSKKKPQIDENGLNENGTVENVGTQLPQSKKKKKKTNKKKKNSKIVNGTVENVGTQLAQTKKKKKNKKKTNKKKKNAKIEKDTKKEVTANARAKSKNWESTEPKKTGGKDSKGGRLADTCQGVAIIGDSQARGLQPLMDARLPTGVTVRSLPGKGNVAIRREAEKSSISDSNVVALMVSGNDLYRRYGRVGSTEEIISEVMGAVDDCGLKTRRRVVVGMLPRRGASCTALSKNISINRRLGDLCTAEGVFFVDPYKVFYGQNRLYSWDGVHLSLRGKAVLSNMLAQVIRRTRMSVKPELPRPRVYTPVTPETTFSEVVKRGTQKDPKAEKQGNGRA